MGATVANDDDVREPPPQGMDPAVFTYLSEAFGRLSGQIADSTRASLTAVQIGRETAQRVERLEWHVFGSKPPPPLPKPPPAAASVVGRVSENELEVDAAKAEQLIQASRLARVEAELKAQSKAMGLASPVASRKERWSTFLGSRAGRSFALKLATLVVTALGLVASMQASHKAGDAAAAATTAAAAQPLNPPGKVP